MTQAVRYQKRSYQQGKPLGLFTARFTLFALKCLNKAKVKWRAHIRKEMEESIVGKEGRHKENGRQNTKTNASM